MKTTTTALLLVAFAALTVAPKPAQAGDKELALIGGLIGGIIIGSAINDSRPVYETDTHVIYQAGYNRGNFECTPYGDYGYQVVNVWVPGYWEYQFSFGHRVQVYVPGRYVQHRNRVLIANTGHHHPNYSHHDRRGNDNDRGGRSGRNDRRRR
ncbi:MAG: hypothetical protein Q8J74_13085 [Candidatus Didemnitutus sp.]|nr:hypothetical protein [Candidatus Didemnitutus sp.]